MADKRRMEVAVEVAEAEGGAKDGGVAAAAATQATEGAAMPRREMPTERVGKEAAVAVAVVVADPLVRRRANRVRNRNRNDVMGGSVTK